MKNLKVKALMGVKYFIMSVFMFFSWVTFGQAPTHLPQRDPDPVDFSPERIIFFIGLPVVIFIIYLLWRRRTRND
jgi:hypothetical protein